MRLTILLLITTCFLSCSKDKDEKVDIKKLKTDIVLSKKDTYNLGAFGININGTYPGNSGKERYELTEGDLIELTAIPRESDMWVSARIGGKSIIDDTVKLGDTLLFTKTISKQYLDSIGAFTWE